MLTAHESQISSNARLKSYPICSVLQVANAEIFREKGWEPRKRPYEVAPKGKSKDPLRSLEVSRARARRAVQDIALCNPFTHFFTWTLDKEKVDRYDDDQVKTKLTNTLRHLVQRKGFSYVCVPERHKDGALHFHGLCIPGTVRLERALSPKGRALSTKRCQPIYNMKDWPWGYSTCIPIDENYRRTANYLVKYITKDKEKIFGKWYLSSRNLTKQPDMALISGMDYDSFLAENPGSPVIPLYQDVCIGVKEFPIALTVSP